MAHFPFTMQLGAVLRRVRKSENVSMEKLGLMVGTSRRHISNIEKGEVNTSIEMLYRLAEGLGVSLAGIIQERSTALRAREPPAPAGAAPEWTGAGIWEGVAPPVRPAPGGVRRRLGCARKRPRRPTGGSDMDAGMRARAEAAGRQEAQRRACRDGNVS